MISVDFRKLSLFTDESKDLDQVEMTLKHLNLI